MNEMSHNFSFAPETKRVLGSAEILRFHREHFAELAKRHNQKWLNRIAIAVGLKDTKDEVSIAQDQAEAEKNDFEARHNREFQKWQEGLRRVLNELELIKNDPEAAEKKGLRPLLLVMGGGMRGPYCAGQVAGLHDVGYGDVFKNVVGFSAGSGPAAYFVAGPEQVRNATSLFREECATSEFLDLTRISKVIDASVIAKNMRSGPKALDQEAIRRSSVGVYAGVTNTETGEVEFLDFKSATRDGKPDMVAACEASSAIPLFEKPFEVNGKMYLDGSLDEVPFDKLIEKFNPTSILVLPNMAFSELDALEATSVERMVLWAAKLLGSEGSLGAGPLASRKTDTGSLHFADALKQTLGMKVGTSKSLRSIEQQLTQEEELQVKREARKTLEAIEENTQVKIGVLWPPQGGLGNLTNDPGTIESAIITAHTDVYKQVGRALPQEMWF